MFDHKRRNDINENATLKRNIVQENKMEKKLKAIYSDNNSVI